MGKLAALLYQTLCRCGELAAPSPRALPHCWPYSGAARGGKLPPMGVWKDR